jgi:hypothetical protein
LKSPSQKRAGGVVQGVGPEFKHQYHTHKKTNQTNKKLYSSKNSRKSEKASHRLEEGICNRYNQKRTNFQII